MDATEDATDGGGDASDATPPTDAAIDECGDEELCGGGFDDDCDGAVDEGCACAPGEIASCYRGPRSTRGVGLCRDGRMRCEGEVEFGFWGPCEDDVTPAMEICDGVADEDCDGALDDGCECVVDSGPLPCGTDVGECTAGVQSCVDGMLTACEGAVGPRGETCDGTDED
ncbi:MAG: hypothetical protein GWN73_13105, partial [Actinobacteria bacterium]|nr:hypothetical protein [Actinomycetota bacterium]NIU66300.1 hypothetical protein [Actinomycetota bacterium]